MDKKEITALRRPFVKELFQKNMFNLVMTVLAAFLVAASNLVISWTIKAISDLISGDTATSYGTLLLVASVGFVMMLAAWLLDRTFLSKFRAKAMQQYRKYVFRPSPARTALAISQRCPTMRTPSNRTISGCCKT